MAGDPIDGYFPAPVCAAPSPRGKEPNATMATISGWIPAAMSPKAPSLCVSNLLRNIDPNLPPSTPRLPHLTSPESRIDFWKQKRRTLFVCMVQKIEIRRGMSCSAFSSRVGTFCYFQRATSSSRRTNYDRLNSLCSLVLLSSSSFPDDGSLGWLARAHGRKGRLE